MEVAAERQVVHREITIEDGQVTAREYVRTERVFYGRIVDAIYTAALSEPKEFEKPNFNEKCIDCCFQTFSSGRIRKLLCREDDFELPEGVDTITHLSKILRRGRSKGWLLHTNMIFPLVNSTFRNCWVAGQLLMIFLSLVLSITNLTLGDIHVFNIVHIVLSCLGTILAVTDGTALLWSCYLFKRCKGINNSSANEASGEANIESISCSEKCQQRIQNSRDAIDVARMVLAELILYPLLICNLFEFITGQSYLFRDARDGVTFFLFIISIVMLFSFAYIVQSYIVIVANYNSQKKRSPPKENTANHDRSIRQSALCLQSYFVFHVIAQMVVQILMLIGIGGSIHEGNKHLFTDDPNSDQSVHVNWYLWYMIVSGYLLPMFGILTFFIVTYFWVQEFPIGICIDVISTLTLPGINEVLKMNEGGIDKLRRITEYVNLSELKNEFKTLRETAWFDKFSYSFRSPQTVIISLLYSYLLSGYIVCCIFTLNANWVPFMIVASILGSIANLYVFLVSIFWSVIIVGIFIVCIILIALCCVGLRGVLTDDD